MRAHYWASIGERVPGRGVRSGRCGVKLRELGTRTDDPFFAPARLSPPSVAIRAALAAAEAGECGTKRSSSPPGQCGFAATFRCATPRVASFADARRIAAAMEAVAGTSLRVVVGWA
jgi:hypothetical protein